MQQIHLIDGEKGGVGKSLFARVLVEYCLWKGLEFKLVDADRTNPDVGHIYQSIHPTLTCYGNSNDKGDSEELKPIFFSEDEKKSYETDRIFEMAMSVSVIVNLPANVYPLVTDWIEKNDLLSLGEKHGVNICKWFICNGGYDSIRLFMDSLKHFNGKLPHVLVRNWGLSDSWSHLSSDESLMNLINSYDVKVIDFPKLAYKERNLIDRNKWTFIQAMKSDELGIIAKQRVRMFLEKAYGGIEAAELLKFNSI